ncbi:MAG: TerC family protein [Ignavibacteria bacterium]|nr:TerC family protein [Ignavibacteria bacterium]
MTLNWTLFIVFIIIMLLLDLGIFNKRQHEIKTKEALITSGIWVAMALVFNVFVFYYFEHQSGIDFFTGYLLEKSLSVDNIFVFILIFTYFDIPNKYQHKILYWGIFGALIMRAILIILGAALITKFSWMVIVFGIFLIIIGLKMAFQKHEKFEPEKNPIVRFAKKVFPIISEYRNGDFFVKIKGKGLFATPLLLVLITVETTDLIFAFDSIPAILAITQDTFIVFTSNAFAILGLRALYFALAGFMDKFFYLKTGISVILVFIGIKMLISPVLHITTVTSLIIILIIFAVSISASLAREKALKEKHRK